ncbi:penicillin-binding transpeptidase domain-containing protein [Dermatophilaceae bacterium Soc4.6]
MRPGRPTTVAALSAFVVGVGALAACDTISPPPGPDDAAKALAAGLANGALTAIPFDGSTGEAATTYVATAVGDLKSVRRTVAVTSVTTDPTNQKLATATLTWAWALSSTDAATGSTATPSASATTTSATTATTAATWTYTVDATLTLAADKTWHTTWTPSLLAPDLTATEQLTVSRTSGKRADIVGAGNTPLMTSRDVFQVGIDKGRITSAQAPGSAAALAKVIGIDGAGFAKRVTAAGAKAFVVGLTVRATDPLATSRAAQVSAVPGGVSIPASDVLGPTPTFAKAMLGTVGEATAEIISASNGTLKAGDVVGLSGLEQRYDARLRGTQGLTVDAVGTDAAGKKVSRELFSRDATDGTPLRVTLDLGAQVAAEAALGSQTTTPTALVAIRPSTGEVVAAANGPAASGQVATTGHAAPGSTFKIVTALALLRAGLTPDTPVACTPTVTVDGRSFKNYDDYPADKIGTIALRTAFANSCNTAFIANQAKITQAGLAEAAASLGIGVDLDLGIPAYLGSVPATGTGTTHAASMIGQAQVEVAPMDMATVVASVIKGSVVRPALVYDNPAVSSFPRPAKPLTGPEAASLRSLMGAVVTEGSGRVLAPNGVTLAKTGTAEFGTATPPLTHAWMVAGKGDLAVVAYVEEGQSGSRSAAPLIAAFLSRYAG